MSELKGQTPSANGRDLDSLLHLSHPSKCFVDLAQKIQATSSSVDRLKITFDFMREALSDGFSEKRSEFWQAKQIALHLFKEPVEQTFRYPLWQQFTEILDSADLAGEVIAENSVFYFEQFSLALKDLHTQVSTADEALEQSISLLDKLGFDGTQHAMEEFVQGLDSELIALQYRLERFHQFAVRYRTLREEIVACALKPRDKRELFSQLKEIKEKIFPQRADLITQVDSLFDEEVSHFVVHALECGEPAKPIYVLKQQLKGLQRFAKTLGLSSKVFKTTRLKLSELWDLLSALEGAQREKMREQRAQCKLNAFHIDEKIELVKSEIPKLSYDQLLSRIKQVIRFMHGAHLLREDKKRLRDHLEALKEPFLKESACKQRKEHEIRESKNQAALAAFKGFVSELAAVDVKSENYAQQRALLEEKAGSLNLSSSQLREVQMRLADLENSYRKTIRAQIHATGDSDQIARHEAEEKSRLKAKLDSLKKEKARMGMDFERGLALEEEIAHIKDQLGG